MDGLFFLSKYCTSLLNLDVHFNAPQSRIFNHSASAADEGRVPIQNLFNQASDCNLRWLYVHELPFPTAPNSVGIMTYFLIHLFPHLNTFGLTGSLSESWVETQRGILAWQAFRRITVPGGTWIPQPLMAADLIFSQRSPILCPPMTSLVRDFEPKDVRAGKCN
jgi:hypothetical protein